MTLTDATKRPFRARAHDLGQKRQSAPPDRDAATPERDDLGYHGTIWSSTEARQIELAPSTGAFAMPINALQGLRKGLRYALTAQGE
jgi:hypothetical protein